MSRLISVLVTLVIFLLVPVTFAHAHLGGGPPFLSINDKYAQTNPYNQGASVMTIPWDTAPSTYVVNQPIKFFINLPELMKATTVPEQYAKDIMIRWSVATGDNFEIKDPQFQNGSAITKQFTNPGSYLVIMEAKLPNDSDYILINTVQIDVLPTANFKPPAASAFVGTQYDDPKKNVLIVSDSIFDKTAKPKKYLWDFGDGVLTQGSSINKRLEKAESVGVEPVFHRVIDDKGFISDVAFVAVKENNKLKFTSFVPNGALPVAIGTYQEAQAYSESASKKLSLPLFLSLGFGALILIGYSWWLFFKKSAAPEHKTRK